MNKDERIAVKPRVWFYLWVVHWLAVANAVVVVFS